MAKEIAPDAALRQALRAMAVAEEVDLEVGGVPVRWQQDPRWRCANTHVSSHCNEGRRGRRTCVFKFCTLPVYPTFPEDRSGPLGG